MSAKNLLNLFSDRLRTLPLMVLYLTDGCNSRCVTCDIWRNPRRNMAMGLVEQLASACQELRVRWVLLSGGEAMQHPQWPEIARRFRQVGVRVLLLTNGLLLRRQIEEVLSSVDELIVSLDGGTAETYAAIRGVDAFDLVLEGVRLARSGGLPVTTRTTVQRANYREIPQIIAAARDVDVNFISFLAVDVSNQYAFGPRFAEPALVADGALPLVASMGPGAPSEHGPLATALSLADVDALEATLDEAEARFAPEFAEGRIVESPEKLRRILVQYFRALHGEAEFPRPRCNAPHFSTVIEVDGTLRPCYFLPSYGRLRPDGTPLWEALNNEAAQALRRAYRTGQRIECQSCVCPLYKGPRALTKM